MVQVSEDGGPGSGRAVGGTEGSPDGINGTLRGLGCPCGRTGVARESGILGRGENAEQGREPATEEEERDPGCTGPWALSDPLPLPLSLLSLKECQLEPLSLTSLCATLEQCPGPLEVQ